MGRSARASHGQAIQGLAVKPTDPPRISFWQIPRLHRSASVLVERYFKLGAELVSSTIPLLQWLASLVVQVHDQWSYLVSN